jgi:hypothetical protein
MARETTGPLSAGMSVLTSTGTSRWPLDEYRSMNHLNLSSKAYKQVVILELKSAAYIAHMHKNECKACDSGRCSKFSRTTSFQVRACRLLVDLLVKQDLFKALLRFSSSRNLDRIYV